jgi:hypothetical protein
MRTTLTQTVIILFTLASPVFPQAPRDARLILTVVDTSGGVIPHAAVTIAGLDDSTKTRPLPIVHTTIEGIAIVDALSPGRYSIRVEFDGFETRVIEDLRLHAGENRRAVTLAIRKVEDSLTVSPDAQAAAADPRGRAFKTELTVEEIVALPDDPEEMLRQLLEMAGGNAIIRVDGFEGTRLPPKAQIKSIRIVRDPFAAQNHSAESDEIEIITQPGKGPIRGSGRSRIRDSAMNGRSPFAPTKGAERRETYEGDLGGTIVENRSSFSVSVEHRNSFDTPLLNVALPDGTRSEALDLRRPNDRWTLYGLVDYALTPNQMLRLSYEYQDTHRQNQGVGAYDLPERAYDTARRSTICGCSSSARWGGASSRTRGSRSSGPASDRTRPSRRRPSA